MSNDDSDNIGLNKKKCANNVEDYSLVVSNITEVGLINNLSKINTMLLHSDGDIALHKLGYYEQGKHETSAGISLFCDASDRLRSGFIRGTGVSQVKINRPVALFNMFIASTGTKMIHMLQKFNDTLVQDGVYGRVFYTWCPSVTELPQPKSTGFTNIASFSHFAYAIACLFHNQFQFRHSTGPSDLVESNTECTYLEKSLHIGEKLKEIRSQHHPEILQSIATIS